jgi:hypothetical protein
MRGIAWLGGRLIFSLPEQRNHKPLLLLIKRLAIAGFFIGNHTPTYI